MSNDDNTTEELNVPEEKPNNVASFFTGKSLDKNDLEGVSNDQWEEFLKQGIEAFNTQVSTAGTKAFISLVFDENNRPRIIWAGDIEIINVLGALELAKHDFINNTFSITVDE